MDEIYLKITDHNAYVHMLWSSNDTWDEKSTGVIGIYVYDGSGNEHPKIEGGELDVYDDGTLSDHIKDVLEFIEIPETEYEMITMEDFYSIVD